MPGRLASLFFHFAKRTNQAEGCYQNFRLRDKLNYGGNSGIGGHTAENCDGEKKLRDRKVKNGPRCKSVAATRKSVIAREEKRAQLKGCIIPGFFRDRTAWVQNANCSREYL